MVSHCYTTTTLAVRPASCAPRPSYLIFYDPTLVEQVELSYQDDGKTLKIFLSGERKYNCRHCRAVVTIQTSAGGQLRQYLGPDGCTHVCKPQGPVW